MDTYFIRHTDKLDIDTATFERLWNERRIAIHFPDYADRKRKKHDRDNTSLNPDDYKRGKRQMHVLRELGKNGGYVCAQFFGHSECMVGRVRAHSKIDLITGTWGSRNGYDGQKAKLKSLRLSKVRLVRPSDSALLLVGRPQQGTITRWKKARAVVRNIVNGKRTKPSLSLLSPDQQEIMCSEYLRSPSAAKLGLPRLAHLMLPVGRTMKAIDIYGINDSGHRIFAQVTYERIEHCREKLEALREYGDQDEDALILFCDCGEPRSSSSVKIVPLRMVYDSFVATSTGKLWIERATVHVGAQR
jgi:hypothetical protein